MRDMASMIITLSAWGTVNHRKRIAPDMADWKFRRAIAASVRAHHSSKGGGGWKSHGKMHLPSLLSCKSFVEERKHLGDIELDIFQIEVFKVVFLHLQEIVKLEIKLE